VWAFGVFFFPLDGELDRSSPGGVFGEGCLERREKGARSLILEEWGQNKVYKSIKDKYIRIGSRIGGTASFVVWECCLFVGEWLPPKLSSGETVKRLGVNNSNRQTGVETRNYTMEKSFTMKVATWSVQ